MIEGALEELRADAHLEELGVLVEPDLCVARISPGSSRPPAELAGARPTA